MKLLTKFTYILLVCAMLLSCVAVGAGAETAEADTTAPPTETTSPEVPVEPDVVGTDDFEYILNGGYATITAYHGEGNRVIIPAALDGYPVEAIGGSVFKDRTDIIKVDFEQGALHVIGEYAFMGCTALEEILLPDTTESIDRAAFEGCTALYRVELGDSLLKIGTRAFSGCESLDGIYIPATATFADEFSFKYCTSLRNIIVAGTEFTFDSEAFNTEGIQVFAPAGAAVHKNTTGYNALVAAGAEALVLKSTVGGLMIEDVVGSPSCVIVPESAGGTIVSVGKEAFTKISAMQAVYLPDTITTINEAAFRDCIYLRYIRMPATLTVNLGKNVFYGCGRLTRIHLPEGIETIGTNCFYGCDSLSLVTFPRSLNRLQSGAFYGCTDLSTLVFRGDAPDCAFPDGAEKDISFYGMPEGVRVLTDAARAWPATWSPNGKKYGTLAVTARNYDCFYVEVILTPTTCAADGLSMLMCPDCGDSFTRVYPKTEHNFVSVGVSDGAETYRCTACTANYTIKRLEIAQIIARIDRAKQGAEMIQSVTVGYRGVTLTEGVDYTYSVDYLRNYNRLVLTVRGMGEYGGSAEVAYSSLTANQLNTYSLTVVGDASGAGRYYRDDVVTLTPNQPTPDGMVAVWSSDEVTLRTSRDSSATFEMPAKDVTVTLTYEKAPETTPPAPPVTTPPETQPPVTTPPVTEPPVTAPPVTEPPVTTPSGPVETDPPFGDSDIARGFISRAIVLTAILVVSFVGFVVVCVFMFKKDKKS